MRQAIRKHNRPAIRQHTTGCEATYASYRIAMGSPTRPITSGAMTWADDQGKVTPAQVRAMMQDVALPMMMMLPLSKEMSLNSSY